MLDRRLFIIASAAAGLRSSNVAAQTWPIRYIRGVVPFPPGGTVDIVARLAGATASTLLGQQIVVENRPGAGGNIGNAVVAHAKPDGYTILFTQGGLAVNQFLYRSLGYDPVGDFTPVSLLVNVPNVVVVPSASPVKTIAGLVAYAKSKPVFYASAGIGTSSHLSGELLKRKLGIDMTHVPYAGTAPALTDLLSGRVQVMCDNVSSLLPQIRAGTVLALAVTAAQRLPVLPDVPTMRETGMADFTASGWTAAFAPANTPVEIVAHLNNALVDAIRQPKVGDLLTHDGDVVVGSSPSELQTFVQSERDNWGPVIQEAHIRVGD